jgi:PAS domain S-box-containing protein
MKSGSSRDNSRETFSLPLKITATYVVVGALWISFSDKILELLVPDPTALARVAFLKGWGCVAATSWMLYALISRGISRLERSEAEARSNEAQYRELVESANSIILRMDVDGNITFFNEFAQRFLGYGRDEIIGRNVIGTIVPDVDSSGRNLREMIDDIGKHPERYVNNANENMRKNGERVWIAWTNKPIRNDQDRIVEILCIGNDVTERKRAEEVLLRYELLAGHSRDILLFMRQDDGRILEANLAAEKAYGYSREELLRLNMHDLRAPGTSGETPEQMARADSQGSLFETVHRRRDGGTFPVEVSSRGGTIGGIRTLICVVRDITERKQAEESLRAHEERLRLAMEAAQQGWFDLNVQTGEVSVSPEYARIIGYEPEELKTDLQGWINGVHPDDRDAVLKVYGECLETGDTRTMEYRRQTRTGDWMWIRSVGRIVQYDSERRPLRMTGTHADISVRKQVEEALRESEERFRELAELLPETIFEMDASGTLTFVNRSALDHFGFSRADFDAGLNNFEMFPPEERPRAMENVARVMQGEKIGLTEYRMLRKDGSTFPAVLHSSAKYRDGRPVGLRGIVIDLTKTKELESQLRQAHKMEAVGTLAGGIAHDFNNLLQAVLGYADLLLMKKQEGEEGCRELNAIRRAAGRGGELTRQLLTFSRKVESRLQLVDLNRLLIDVGLLLERTIPNTIRIELHLGEDLRGVYADGSQIEKVLMNLAVNAKDAMPDGGTFSLETKNVVLDEESRRSQPDWTPGRYVRLTVSDTGQGMDRATLEHIFDPFFTTKELGKGAGLGLAMVYGIVRNHHGHITCRSDPGEGTSFEIYLPANERQDGDFQSVLEK